MKFITSGGDPVSQRFINRFLKDGLIKVRNPYNLGYYDLTERGIEVLKQNAYI
jgi:hypothetical protein